MVLIKNHFGLKLYQRYVDEIFENEKNSDYVLYRTDKDKEKFERRFQKIYIPTSVCQFWLFNVLNMKDNTDDYIDHQSIIKQKTKPRTNQLKMSLTQEEFYEYYLDKNKDLTKGDICRISFYKLLYYYLIQPKRLFINNIFAIYLRCSKDHLHCTNSICSTNYEYDLNSSIGCCIRFYSDRTRYQAGIKGIFKSILPGIYEILFRIKLDKNEKFLSDHNKSFNQDSSSEKQTHCYFYALADYGHDCECNGKVMDYDRFESNYIFYGNNQWFNQIMGYIQVFQLSNIYFGFNIRDNTSYLNILFDYIQLNIVK
ncbi:hypothetical protein I4U23_031286 [Adineta vaga]|nr:hypothetical protein I4U23_031286 [Adineta vaga]